MKHPEELRRLPLLFLFFATAIQAGGTSAQLEDFLPLSGFVRDEDGHSLPGASVTARLRDGQGSRMGISDGSGRFRLPLREGVYDVKVELDGFESRAFEGIHVSLEAAPPAELEIVLESIYRDIVFIPGLGPDSVSTECHFNGTPTPIPAPAVDVSFRFAGSAAADRSKEGLVRLANAGSEPVLIPTRWRSRDELYRSEYLALNLEVTSSRGVAEHGTLFFSDWLYCWPRHIAGRPPEATEACRSLTPGEVIEFPVELWRDADRLSRFSGVVKASFILPGTDQRTEYVEAGFDLDAGVAGD